MQIGRYIDVNLDKMVDDGMCLDCEAIEHEPDIGFEDCPACGDCSDRSCVRFDSWSEIVEKLEQIDDEIGIFVEG